MEVLAALSLAGTIVQFVDFGIKILRSGRGIYTSATATLAANDELKLVASDLTTIIAKIRHEDRFTDEFEAICDEAVKVAQELLDRLETLGNKRKIELWQTLKQAVQSVLSKEEIKSLQERLQRLRQALETNILTSIRYKIDIESLRISKRFDDLDLQTQRIIEALLQPPKQSFNGVKSEYQLQDQTLAITQMLNRIERTNLEEHQRTRSLIVGGSTNCKPKITLQPELFSVSLAEEEGLRLSVQTFILKSLQFPTMRSRYDEIADAYQKTFNWIFCDESSSPLPWSCFDDWLDNGRGIYWIQGKAGSGKSTLMRYLCNDPRTKEHLQKWSNGSAFQILNFFFWNSGTVEQNSLSGLLQALLFEVLHEHTDLIPVLFPTEWARLYSRSLEGMPKVAKTAWQLPNLMEAFTLLITQTVVPLKLCMFIDGLDEYTGDHEEIANIFKDMTKSRSVKACISSRPWLTFRDSFQGCSSLRLQDLTRGDIEHYTSSKLNNKHLFKSLAEKEPELAPSLIIEIVNKADGVFLWVRLVVMSLLKGLTDRDGIPDLQRRLHIIPKDLESLFEQMIGLIDPIHKEHASQIFQIVRTSREHRNYLGPMPSGDQPISLLALYFALSPNVTPATVKSYNQEDIMTRCETMEAQLTARCAGLLEVSGTGQEKGDRRIQYLHRTAKDFVETPEVWDKILAYNASRTFNPNARMLSSCFLQLHMPWMGTVNTAQNIARSAMIYAYFAEIQTGEPNLLLLEQLDEVMTKHARRWPDRTGLHWSNGRIPDGARDAGAVVEEFPSFLSYAIQSGLCQYVKSKLAPFRDSAELVKQTSWGPGHSKVNRSLLNYAVCPFSQNLAISRTPGIISEEDDEEEFGESLGRVKVVYPCNPELVAFLLKLGADLNQRSVSTPWQTALHGLAGEAWEVPQFGRPPDEILRHFQIIEMLLKAGANTKVFICPNYYDEPQSVSAIIGRFKARYPELFSVSHSMVQHESVNSRYPEIFSVSQSMVQPFSVEMKSSEIIGQRIHLTTSPQRNKFWTRFRRTWKEK